MIKLKSILASLVLATLSLAPAYGQVMQLGSGQVIGNTGTSQARGQATNISPLLDRAFGSTRGAIMERGSSGWAIIAPSSTAGLPYVGNGTGADPAYQLLTGAAFGSQSANLFWATPSGSAGVPIFRAITTADLPSLASTQVYIGNVSSIPTAKTISGDCTLSNSGVLTCLDTNGTPFGTFATQSYATPPAIGGTTPNTATFSGLTLSGITGSTQCLQVNSSGQVIGAAGACGTAGSALLSGSVLSKTAAYAAVTGDCGSTISLSGSALYTLTLNAASGYSSNCGFVVVNQDTGRGKTIAVNGYSNFTLWPLQTAIIYKGGSTAWQISRPSRWQLPATTTFYVDNSLGSNNNDCLASGAGACGSINGAISLIAQQIDLNGQQVTIQLANETFAENVETQNYISSSTSAQQGTMCIVGNMTTPSDVVIAPASGVGVQSVNVATPWCFKGLQINATSAQEVQADFGSNLYLDKIVYGGTPTIFKQALYGSKIEIGVDGETINVGGQAFDGVSDGGQILYQGGTETLVGTPAFSAAFAVASTNGLINYTGVSFSGSATGTRFQITTGGQIQSSQTDLNNAVAGNVTGTANTSPLPLGASAKGYPIHGSSCRIGTTTNSTQYVSVCDIGSSEVGFVLSPELMTLANLVVFANTSPGSGQQFTVTLRVGGASTALTCNITGTNNTCSDTTHTAQVSAGGAMDLQVVSSASAASSVIAWGVLGQ